MEAEQFDFSVVFPNIAAQLRSVLGNLHLAAAQLAPAIRREGLFVTAHSVPARPKTAQGGQRHEH